MTDDLDRSDELREWYAEDERRDAAAGNGYHYDDPGPGEPPDINDHHPGEWNGQPTPDSRSDGAGQPKRERSTLRMQLLSVSDLGKLPAVKPLVDGLLYRNTLAQLSGPPGSFKSFISIDISCALASGQASWEGHRIPARERVVYVAAEGASGLRARIYAWCEHHAVDPSRLEGWLYILPIPLQLGAAVHVDQGAEMAQDVAAGLLVLDTRARCTVGLEENSATEQGRAVDAADRIRAATGCTVWGIHHSVRNGSTPRGSTAWDGAVWTDLRVTAEDTAVSVKVEKHKDAPSGKTYEYRMIPHTVSADLVPDLQEQERKSLVIFSHADRENQGRILTKFLKQAANIAENSCGTEGLTRTQLVDLCVAAGMSKATAYRAVNALIEKSFLHNVGTVNRCRYAYIGPTLDGDDDDQF